MTSLRDAKWVSSALLLLLVFALALVPAHANDDGIDSDDDDDSAIDSDSDLGSPMTRLAFDPRYAGGIHPTNVPLVASDFTSGSMSFSIEAALQIEAPAAHGTATGAGVIVAVLDGGFNLAHPTIADHISPYAYDAIDHDADPTDLGNGIDDDFDGLVDEGLGHGTFVAGMVLLAAPDAILLPIRVRDDEGWGTNEELRIGLDYAIDMEVDVINLSIDLAPQRTLEEIEDLLEAASTREIVVVISAGNDGANRICWQPTYATETVVVGAVDATDTIAPFSNYEANAPSWIMAFAPGVDLCGPFGFPTSDSMAYWSGTSFATGIVSGGVALVREIHPDGLLSDVHSALTEAFEPVRTSSGEPYGWGGRISLRRLVN